MKKTKLLLALLTVFLLTCSCALLISCQDNNDDDKNATQGLSYRLNDDGSSYSVTGIGEATVTKLVTRMVTPGLYRCILL